MAIEEALTSVLSGIAGGRRYWLRAPQGQLAAPFLVLTTISRPRDYHMTADSGFLISRFQIDAYGETYTSAKETARSVISTLSGYSATVSGTVIQGTFIDSERDLEAAAPGETSNLFRVSIDVVIAHD